MIDKHLILAAFLQKPVLNIKIRARDINSRCVLLDGRYYYFDKNNNLHFTSNKSPEERNRAEKYLRKVTIPGAKEANSGEHFKRFEFEDGSQIIINSLEDVGNANKQIEDVSNEKSNRE